VRIPAGAALAIRDSHSACNSSISVFKRSASIHTDPIFHHWALLPGDRDTDRVHYQRFECGKSRCDRNLQPDTCKRSTIYLDERRVVHEGNRVLSFLMDMVEVKEGNVDGRIETCLFVGIKFGGITISYCHSKNVPRPGL
jgi:hypothetical protein